MLTLRSWRSLHSIGNAYYKHRAPNGAAFSDTLSSLLLVSQRNHGIDFQGAAGRHVTGRQRHEGQQQGDEREG